MDNDAAHHALIALRMHLTGDYVNLVDQGEDYLDKPHLHFWLAALGYKIFGTTGFAYKFPSFLFAILGVYSTFRLGAILYNKETGRLAALLLATAMGYLLSVSDVRMDAILTSCIAFASWQMISLVKNGRWINVAGAALGLALGFSTKGHIAVFVPAVLSLFYLLWRGDLQTVISTKWLTLIVLFFLFISPVLYCYYLQFNLHPEKLVRGKDHIDGVRFILFDQVFDRMTGKMEKETNNDPFFFFHSIVPAFAPWSILAYLSVIERLRQFGNQKHEYATAGVFIVILVFVTLSKYQLPHYLNIIFPSTAILVAAFLFHHQFSRKWTQAILVIQMTVTLIILIASALINAWAFPVNRFIVVAGVVILLSLVFYFIRSNQYSILQKSVLVPASAMIFFFFLMNTNFYPQLLQYQAGQHLARATKEITGKEPVYYWKNTFSSSFNFYSRTFRLPFHDSVLRSKEKVWLLYDEREASSIKENYKLGDPKWAAEDYEVTRLTLKFLDPKRRKNECSKLVMAELFQLK